MTLYKCGFPRCDYKSSSSNAYSSHLVKKHPKIRAAAKKGITKKRTGGSGAVYGDNVLTLFPRM